MNANNKVLSQRFFTQVRASLPMISNNDADLGRCVRVSNSSRLGWNAINECQCGSRLVRMAFPKRPKDAPFPTTHAACDHHLVVGGHSNATAASHSRSGLAKGLASVRIRLTPVASVVVTTVLALFGCTCCDKSLAHEKTARGSFDNVGPRAAPLRLWLEERGRGEPILMLHGFGASSYTWRYIAPALARTHRVVSIDLKGSGRSDKPFDDNYGVLDQVALLKRLIDHRGLTDLTLVGHSFGGGVALALALDLNGTRPAVLKRLVLIDSIAYRQKLPIFIQLLRTPVVARIGMYAVLPEIESFQGLYAAYHDPRKITLDAVRAYALPLYEPGGRYALLKTAEEIIPSNLSALVARYHTIRQQTQLIWCAEDPVVPLWVGHKLARNLADAHLSVLRGCGHAPQEELPLQTLALIRKFLQ